MLTDKKSKIFTNGMMVQIDLQRATVAFPQFVLAMHLNNIALLCFQCESVKLMSFVYSKQDALTTFPLCKFEFEFPEILSSNHE